jgi:uncharacterized membrane protein (UPF0127 family)
MFRKGIAFSEGMLFIFEEEARHAFWMKNMKFSIDIIWLSKDKRVVDIASNVLPCVQDCPRLVPKQDAKYVLETAAGFCAKYNIRPGDQLCW